MEALTLAALPDASAAPAVKKPKSAIIAGLSLLVGNIFLAYFVGVDRLAHWVQA